MKFSQIQKTAFSLVFLMTGIIIIYSSEKIAVGVSDGIELCLKSVIPSLYIFTVLCLFIVKCNIFESPLFNFLTNFIFGFRGEEGIIYLLSLFCGYPIGARLLNESVRNGKITIDNAKKMLLFCINPGPAFCITAIGWGCFGNMKIGAILFVSCILSSIICIRFYHPQKSLCKKINPPRKSFGEGFIESVNDANKCMLSICGWIIISISLISFLRKYKVLLPLLCCIEVTSGVVTASKLYSIYYIGFLLGFAGFSVHLQVLSNSKDIKPRYFKILLSRLIMGILSAGFTYLLLKIFPQSVSVSSLNVLPSAEGNTPLTSFCLIAFVCTSLLFMRKKVKSRN